MPRHCWAMPSAHASVVPICRWQYPVSGYQECGYCLCTHRLLASPSRPSTRCRFFRLSGCEEVDLKSGPIRPRRCGRPHDDGLGFRSGPPLCVRTAAWNRNAQRNPFRAENKTRFTGRNIGGCLIHWLPIHDKANLQKRKTGSRLRARLSSELQWRRRNRFARGQI
jgi:hypothetical protein